MSRIKVDAIETTSGRQVYPITAYLKFETSGGTVQNVVGGNVSSVSDLGEGHYQANFTTSLASSSYCLSGSCDKDSPVTEPLLVTTGQFLAASVEFYTPQGNNKTSYRDSPRTSIQIVN